MSKPTFPKKYGTYKSKNKKPSLLSKQSIQIKVNAKWLIIVESPSKCIKIEGFLGPDYQCIASKGHIREIENLKSIDFSKGCKTTYSLIPEKKDHIESIKKIVVRFPKQNILIATDDDREGEGIAWHLCEVLELDILTTKRIIFHEITKPAIIAAVNSPTIINMPLINAYFCRQILDMIVGFKISPLLWKHVYYSKDNSLSAGRCQTPALRLVYDKAKEYEQKVVKLLYKTSASFFTHNGGIIFELNKEFDKGEEVEDFLSESVNFPYKISIEGIKTKTAAPPKPFNTSNLLQRVSSQLNYSPKETMSLCQQLYQDGHITYMRTDSMQYSGPFLKEVSEYVKNGYGEKFIGNLSKIENNDSSNPHEAIRVTHIDNLSIGSENPRITQLYKLIWTNTIESSMSDYEYTTQGIIITAPREYKYKHTVETPLFLGWKIIKETENDKKQRQEKNTSLLFYLQGLSTTSKIEYNYIQSKVSIQGLDKHYTEATLIKELEENGIGRPSTFASIVDTIQERGYVKRCDIEGKKMSINEYILRDNEIEMEETEKVFGNEKNKLVIQDIGIIVCEWLITYFSDLFSYNYTKKLEEELDEIACQKRIPWYDTCNMCLNNIESLISSLSIQKQVYKIDNNHELIYLKEGPVIRVIEQEENPTKKYTYISIKYGLTIDIDKLKQGNYTLEDLIERKEIKIGIYGGSDIYLKSGKYGYYIEWVVKGDTESIIHKKSIQDIITKKKINIETIDQVMINEILEICKTEDNPKDSHNNNNNMIRELTSELSIRKGKFGAYVYYKTDKMKKPEFYNIQKFKGYTTCSIESIIKWLKTTYTTLQIEYINENKIISKI